MGKTQGDKKGAGRSAEKEWDVFIAHSTADQEPFVRQLADGLETAGFRVWYAPLHSSGETACAERLRRD